MKHKHYDLIVAWANGAEIEHLTNDGWENINAPRWLNSATYRIKPEPKPDLVRYLILSTAAYCEPQAGVNAVAIFDGETKKLKSVEML